MNNKTGHLQSGDQFRDLKKILDTLTHTGEKTLDPSELKKLTKICKSSNNYVIHSYHLLMEHLAAKHSEVRLSAFQICVELFKRSHCFRELFVANLQRVMELTAETNSREPMPPPRSAAITLKKTTLVTIQDWAKNYGNAYKKLHLGISFLKNCKKVDFNAMAQQEAAEQSRLEELQRRREALCKERFKKVLDEMKELQPDIINSMTELENCMALLLPKPDELFFEDSKVGSSTSRGMNHSDCGGMSSDEDSSFNEDAVFDFRKYGILNPHFSITLKLDPGQDVVIKKTEENAPIIENANDVFKLINNRYQPCVDKWQIVLKKCIEIDQSASDDALKKVSDLKSRLEFTVDKYKRLKLGTLQTPVDESDTSDSDFEEVKTKEGFEAYSNATPVPIPSTLPSKKSKTCIATKDWSLISEENNIKDPTSALSTLCAVSKSKAATVTKHLDTEEPSAISHVDKHDSVVTEHIHVFKEIVEAEANEEANTDSEPKPSTSSQHRKAKLLAVAPKVPFDVDLYHWEDEKIEAPTRLTVKPDGHRFWLSSVEDRDEVRDPDGEAALRTRVIEFTGDFKPVEWACRAPLPSGKLCPRKDRVKCPFHGKIIARDKLGNPADPQDHRAEVDRLNSEKMNEVPDWQDPKLLADLKESTGIDLRMPDKSKRGWRKHIPGQEEKYVGLTDIKASQNTVYNRLSQKIFKKSSMKRVAAHMDKLDRKRFRDKYGDQFNYVFDH